MDRIFRQDAKDVLPTKGGHLVVDRIHSLFNKTSINNSSTQCNNEIGLRVLERSTTKDKINNVNNDL